MDTKAGSPWIQHTRSSVRFFFFTNAQYLHVHVNHSKRTCGVVCAAGLTHRNGPLTAPWVASTREGATFNAKWRGTSFMIMGSPNGMCMEKQATCVSASSSLYLMKIQVDSKNDTTTVVAHTSSAVRQPEVKRRKYGCA
jgi:hypothetical protein